MFGFSILPVLTPKQVSCTTLLYIIYLNKLHELRFNFKYHSYVKQNFAPSDTF